MSRNEILRIVRALVFLAGSILIVYVMILPGGFAEASNSKSYLLYSWVGAFTLLRPQSVNPFFLTLAAFFYAVYTDEGMAMGSFFLVIFYWIIRSHHAMIRYQSLFVQFLILLVLFALAMISRNLVMAFFFAWVQSVEEILWQCLYFAVSFPICSAVIYLFMRARKFEVEEVK